MIETTLIAELYEGTRLEADIEDVVAWVTVRIVNPSDVSLHVEVSESDGRVTTLTAAPGETAEVSPVPPVFVIEFPSSPWFRFWAGD